MSKKIISSTSHLFKRSRGNKGLPMGKYLLKPILCTIKSFFKSKHAINLFLTLVI